MSKIRHSTALLKEFWMFAKENKAYWIVPLVLVLALMIALISVGQVSAPFIYTLF